MRGQALFRRAQLKALVDMHSLDAGTIDLEACSSCKLLSEDVPCHRSAGPQCFLYFVHILCSSLASSVCRNGLLKKEIRNELHHC